jgi:hypothetical protein
MCLAGGIRVLTPASRAQFVQSMRLSGCFAPIDLDTTGVQKLWGRFSLMFCELATKLDGDAAAAAIAGAEWGSLWAKFLTCAKGFTGHRVPQDSKSY